MFGHLCEVVTVTNWAWLAGVVLHTPHDGHNVLLLEHDVQKSGFVDEKKRAEDVVQVVKTCGVVKVFADVKEFEQFGDVVILLDGLHELLSVQEGVDGGRDLVKDLLQLAELTGGEFDDRALVETRVRQFAVLILCDRD